MGAHFTRPTQTLKSRLHEERKQIMVAENFGVGKLLRARRDYNDKVRALRALHNTYARVSTTDHGVGVRAIRDIPAGVDPFQGIQNHSIAMLKGRDIKELDAPIQSMVRDFFLVSNKTYAFHGGAMHFNDDDEYPVPLSGLNQLDVSFFVNHNDVNPNLVVNEHSNESLTSFVAARLIKAGEELTYDYNAY